MIARETIAPLTAFATAVSADGPARARRRISARSGRALEKLAHAIEYLTDEYVHENSNICWLDGHLQAIELLMSLNRLIYFECPATSSLGDRCRAFVRRRLA